MYKKLLAVLMLLGLANPAHPAYPQDAERVLTQSPARDGAYIIKMPGFVNNLRFRLLDGRRKSNDEGLVIRQSKVKEGTVIIPPSGLYLTSRSNDWLPFNGQLFTLAGNPYYFIADDSHQDVINNVIMRPGDKLYGDSQKSRAWELHNIDARPFGIEGAHIANFNLIKSTGNNFSKQFNIVSGSEITPSANDGSYLQSGNATQNGNIAASPRSMPPYLIGNNISADACSAVIVDEITPRVARIREMATSHPTKALISSTPPQTGNYPPGSSFTIGNAQVDILRVDPDAALLKITDKTGKSVEKELRATPEDLKYFPASRQLYANIMARSPSGKELVALNPRKPYGPFADGQVSLLSHADVIELTNGGPWEKDKRFITRLESCPECSYMQEIVLENDKQVEMDAVANRFQGPEEYFTIVIDEITPQGIKAWHLENSRGKSDNLAQRARGQHIDLVLGANCATTAHFFQRVYPQLYKESLGIQ